MIVWLCAFAVKTKYYTYWGCYTCNWTQFLFENLKKNIWIAIEVVYLKMSFSLCVWCIVPAKDRSLCVCEYKLETLLDTAIDCCFNSVLHCCCPLGIGLWRAHLCCSLASWCVFPGCRWTSPTSTTSYLSAEQEALCLQEIVRIKQTQPRRAQKVTRGSVLLSYWSCPYRPWNPGRPGLRRDERTSICTFRPAGRECLRSDTACTCTHCTLPRSLTSPVAGWKSFRLRRACLAELTCGWAPAVGQLKWL